VKTLLRGANYKLDFSGAFSSHPFEQDRVDLLTGQLAGLIEPARESSPAWRRRSEPDRRQHRQAAGAVGTAAISVTRRNLSKFDHHAQLD
jgi:hypothetical protein